MSLALMCNNAGALKHAMAQLGAAKKESKDDESQSEPRTHGLMGADVLLVTDGELPNPPVSTEVNVPMHRLASLLGNLTRDQMRDSRHGMVEC